MCGRFAQYRSRHDYAAALGWPSGSKASSDRESLARYNVPPGTQPLVMHRLHDGEPMADFMHWGYQPAWAKEKSIPLAINARIEKAASGRYFKHMWKSGRMIVPADGWYEWTGEPRHKQPWYIYLKSGGPLFLAAIAAYKPDREPGAENGFVIVTAAADAGLLDVHDRRPVVLEAEDAELWMDPDLPAEQAEYLARSAARPPEHFEWHKVDTAVNRAGNNGAQLIAPL